MWLRDANSARNHPWPLRALYMAVFVGVVVAAPSTTSDYVGATTLTVAAVGAAMIAVVAAELQLRRVRNVEESGRARAARVAAFAVVVAGSAASEIILPSYISCLIGEVALTLLMALASHIPSRGLASPE